MSALEVVAGDVIHQKVDSLLDMALRGERISHEDGLYLHDHADLLTLGKVADEIRIRMHPEGVVSFIVDRNINYTNVCISGCRFCAFYRHEGDPDAYVLSLGEIGQKVDETLALGGTRILMQGGLHPTLGIEFYEEMLRYIKANHPIEIDCFSPPEIDHISKISNLPVPETLARLKAAGLDGVPGGGAEILDDGVRSVVSPRKIGTQRWLEVMELAQQQGLATSATMMFGVGEKLGQRLMHLVRLREAQDRALEQRGPDGGYTAFIPWTFQPGNTELGGSPETALEYLRMVALARIMLDNVPNIQASWVTQGAKVAQVALRFGANDFGNVMIEENVVRAAGVTFRISKPEIISTIRNAGFQPAQRDTRYRTLQIF